MEFQHRPVLLDECIENLKIRPEGIYIDGTTGGGGHSLEIAKRLGSEGTLICVDRDEEAIKAADARLRETNKKIIFVNRNFSEIQSIVAENAGKPVNGILLDLGVSSYQLDNAERGFSYQNDAPLDMRMDRKQVMTAKDLINTYDKKELIRIISQYGEEKWAVRIAEFICNQRIIKEIETTEQLVDLIKRAVPAPARRDGPHPAKRTFQAIRIEVNNELGMLENAVGNAIKNLQKGGRLCIITFHSLEDRIVKQTYSKFEGKCVCPGDFPICVCNVESFGKIITKKPVEPTEIEVGENPRARSAKLRVFERK